MNGEVRLHVPASIGKQQDMAALVIPMHGPKAQLAAVNVEPLKCDETGAVLRRASVGELAFGSRVAWRCPGSERNPKCGLIVMIARPDILGEWSDSGCQFKPW